MKRPGLIAVAMSGGLDSSMAAWLLARSGEPVVGLSMLLWDRSSEEENGRCCGALDLGDARRVAQQCSIPHYTLRLDEEFRRQVVDPFVEDYFAGRTPVPCVRCNTFLKFDTLLSRAREFGAERLATGHYARIVRGADGWELHRAADPDKDQSYFLFELTQAQLAASLFPLGGMSKREVRAQAHAAGLLVAGKGESMEVCFVASGVREFVEAEAAARPERFAAIALGAPASVVDEAGFELGHAEPAYRYTVGQRRGLRVAGSERLYVLRVDTAANRLVVGSGDSLLAPGLRGERLQWIGAPPGAGEATVRIRARHPGVSARVRALGGDKCEVEFAEPQRGVAPGQAAVFYDGDRVLGGCWIEDRL